MFFFIGIILIVIGIASVSGYYAHKSLWCGVLILGVFFILSSIKKNKEESLVVGVSADFPPFSFIKNGEIVGFDIDIMQEISQRLHKKIDLKNMPFGTLLPSLQLGNIHVIAAGLTATPERAKQVFFTSPYLEDGPLVLVSLKTKPLNSIADLKNEHIAVSQGYTADLYISEIKGPIVVRLQSPADTFLALKSGRAAALITAENTVKPFFDQYGEHLLNIARIPGTGENSCLAVAPKHPEILKEIERALNGMKADGTLQQLRSKWGL